MPLITCKNAAFAYDGNVVVEGLDFSVESGDYISIVGENGSGKSTLLKGLLKLKRPHCGSVEFFDDLLSTQIGYLPQQTPTQQDFPASAAEVVLSGRLSKRGLHPFYSKQDKKIADENCARLGIADIKNKCYRQLSDGQQQRVLLARALCAAERLLLLDEPVAGLDPLVTHELYRLIGEINRDTGMTIVMVSHDIHAAVEYSSKILHIKRKQMFFGSSYDYQNSTLGGKFLGQGGGQ